MEREVPGRIKGVKGSASKRWRFKENRGLGRSGLPPKAAFDLKKNYSQSE